MALNFLVTGVKMLKKSLDKKKMKEGAKKFVGGDKEDKRAKVSKIMDEESSYGEKSKVKKPATISKSKLMKTQQLILILFFLSGLIITSTFLFQKILNLSEKNKLWNTSNEKKDFFMLLFFLIPIFLVIFLLIPHRRLSLIFIRVFS